MLSKLPIRQKLVLAFFFMALVVGITGLFGMHYAGEAVDKAERVSEQLEPLGEAAAQIRRQGLRAHLTLEKVLRGSGEHDIAEVYAGLDEALANCTAILKGGSTDHGKVLPARDPGVRKQIEAASAAIGRFSAAVRARHTQQEGGSIAGLDAALALEFDAFQAAAQAADDAIHEDMTASIAAMQQQALGAKPSIITTILIGLGLALIWSVLTERNFTKPISEVQDAALKVSRGDLDVTLRRRGRDEMGILHDSFNRMVDGLRGTTRQLRDGAMRVTENVTLISSSTTEVSAAQSETSAAMTEAVATVENVKDSVRLTTERAKHVSRISHDAAGVADAGRIAVRSSIDGIQNIRKEMEDIAQGIMALNEQGQAIAEIISTVNDLAERSNLLAVNAAIEAAKAGEEGRGFVVVADEIRGLAEQSKRSTAEVRMILNKIQKDTAASVMAAERGRKAVEQGIRQAAEAGESITAMGGAIEDVAMNASEISSSMQQVDASVNQVFSAMASVLSATQQNESAIGDVASAVNNLAQTATELERRASRYSSTRRAGDRSKLTASVSGSSPDAAVPDTVDERETAEAPA